MNTENSWWAYMIETDNGLLYTGITTNVERRFNEHQNDKKKGAKFFRGKKATHIAFRQACRDRSQASKLEAAIKNLNKNESIKSLTYQNRAFL